MLDKSFGVGQPKRVVKPKILIANTPMDTDKIKIYGSRVSLFKCHSLFVGSVGSNVFPVGIAQVRVDSMMKVAEIEEAEKNKMRAKCQKIIDHGINCFINRQLIYNFPEQVTSIYFPLLKTGMTGLLMNRYSRTRESCRSSTRTSMVSSGSLQLQEERLLLHLTSKSGPH